MDILLQLIVAVYYGKPDKVVDSPQSPKARATVIMRILLMVKLSIQLSAIGKILTFISLIGVLIFDRVS